MTQNKASILKEKIKLAEESVSEMPEGSLKEKAFEVVLASLLKEDNELREKPQAPVQRKTPKKTKNKPDLVEKKSSELQFDENTLRQMKEFYDGFSPAGREQCLFFLSNFIRVKLGKEKFSEADIEYCYQQLLNIRTQTRLPAMNFGQIRQTLSWLVAPSRRKQWLEVDGDGMYHVSAGGKIYFGDRDAQVEHSIEK